MPRLDYDQIHQKRSLERHRRRCMNKCRPVDDRPVDNQPVDHISNLPDAVICHILSLIPTKSAVMTSILSQQWKYMWAKVPLLDFTEMPSSTTYDDLTWQQMIYFRTFVDRALLHNDVSYICCVRLHFKIINDDDGFYFKSWVGAIARREVREIDIYLGCPMRCRLVPLPERFLSCERLVILKLKGNFAIDVRASLHLPNLEIVHFHGVRFPNHEFMKRLSLGSRVLKELHIEYCVVVGTLYVASSTLKTLQIIHIDQEPLAGVVIKAPNLMYLNLGVSSVVSYDICDLNSLVEANLCIRGMKYQDSHQYIVELVSKVSGVTTLELETSAIYGHVSNPPIFSNLTSLRLNVVDENALKLLKSIPKLKYLISTELAVNCWDYTFESESESELLCLPCLELVELNRFIGKEDDFRFVAYLLKAAPLLKEMKIMIRYSLYTELYVGLLMLPRSSTACQVNVIPRWSSDMNEIILSMIEGNYIRECLAWFLSFSDL